MFTELLTDQDCKTIINALINSIPDKIAVSRSRYQRDIIIVYDSQTYIPVTESGQLDRTRSETQEFHLLIKPNGALQHYSTLKRSATDIKMTVLEVYNEKRVMEVIEEINKQKMN